MSRSISSATEDEVRRQLQLKALQQAAGSWKDEDRLELKAGSRAWVRKIRKENERRPGRHLPYD